MTSYIDVINAGLIKLGVKPITSINDPVDAARLAKLRYESIRQRCITEHTWNFARKRISLAPLSTTPIFGYTYQFQLPSDCLRIEDPGVTEYSVEGRLILCHSATLDLLYFADVEDPTQWPPYFRELVASSVALEFAHALTQSAEMKAQLVAELQSVENKAKFRNARENARHRFTAETHLEGRRNQHVDEQLP